jgi:hypothetical protein
MCPVFQPSPAGLPVKIVYGGFVESILCLLFFFSLKEILYRRRGRDTFKIDYVKRSSP